jgi:predicted SprT family Zn-dependent metalloprotease
MIPTLTNVQTWFDEFNASVFNNTLPKVKVTITNTRCQLGQFYWGSGRGIGIKISAYYDAPVDELRNTVLHEMCHLYCYHKGWLHEGHGSHWKQIAAYATKKTGLEITRCHDISEYKVAAVNAVKHEAVQAKKNAPAILLDLCYNDHHFIIKTTKKVLLSGNSTDWNCRVKTTAKSYRVVISDDAKFLCWQTSRSIHRGYRYDNWMYDRDIKPLLDKAIEVDDLCKLFQGHYDCLGIR